MGFCYHGRVRFGPQRRPSTLGEHSLVPLNWMTDCDYQILEFLDRPGLVATTKVIVLNLTSEDCSEPTLKKRVPTLRDRNLIEHPETVPEGVSKKGVYQITELGRRVVSGQISLSELHELEEEGAFDLNGN